MSDLYETPLGGEPPADPFYVSEVGLMPLSEGISEDEMKFVLDSVIDFIEELKLSGEQLRHGGQLLKDVEELRRKL